MKIFCIYFWSRKKLFFLWHLVCVLSVYVEANNKTLSYCPSTLQFFLVILMGKKLLIFPETDVYGLALYMLFFFEN